jgi:uncharacterized protein YbbC (DUF1343 family)
MRTIGLETFLPWTTLFKVLRDMKYSNPTFSLYRWLKYTKHLALKSLFFFLLTACAHGQEAKKQSSTPIRVGAEQMHLYLNFLTEKRVGIVGNQTSMVNEVHLVDTLLSIGVQLKRVFSPEHGFRGDADAGELVNAQKDEKTGLPIFSLYGKTKKPSTQSLADIDVMIFDIQDVGVRFYTYISTLHYVMEACAEKNITLIVLDRPNPNGHYVDGPVLDTNFRSFVGMHPIPIVHGMTIGEYANMINGEDWLPNGLQCELVVIKMENYTHNSPYSLPIPPSPNLRTDLSVSLYPSLCLLEATTVTVGRGTQHPFEIYGHPQFPETGFSFTPKPGYGSKDPKHNGVKCNGYHLNDSSYLKLNKLDLSFLLNANKLLDGKLFVDKEKFFNLLAGNDILFKQISDGMSEIEIRETWKPQLGKFIEMRKSYLLYEL